MMKVSVSSSPVNLLGGSLSVLSLYPLQLVSGGGSGRLQTKTVSRSIQSHCLSLSLTLRKAPLPSPSRVAELLADVSQRYHQLDTLE